MNNKENYFILNEDEESAILAVSFTARVVLISIITAIMMYWLYYITSIEDKELSKKLNSILKETGWRVKVVNVNIANAFTYGTKTLFITKGALKILNEKEIMGVMLHEVGHSKHMDTIKRVSLMVPVVFSGFYFTCRWIDDITFEKKSMYKAISFIILLFFSLKFIQSAESRREEKSADLFVNKYGYGKYLATGLQKLVDSYKKKEHGKLWTKIMSMYESLFSSHPKVAKRIDYILNDEKVNKHIYSGNKSSAIKMAFLKLTGNEKVNPEVISGSVKRMLS